MKEIYKTNRLTIAVIAFALVIIIGLITYKRPDVKYMLSPAESIALLKDTTLVVTPLKAAALLADSAGKTVFIDVRNSMAFKKGHVKNAVNIPVRDLYSKKSKSMLRELGKSGQNAILYGETQQQASGPWFMLRQTGFANVLLFSGSYAQLDMNADSITRLMPQFSETPRIDTLALKKITSPVPAITEAPVAKPVRKAVIPVRQEVSSGGGC